MKSSKTKIATQLDNLPVFILSKELLIRNKRAIGRPQEPADLTSWNARTAS